ncbi:MAG: hypothetical protein WBD87_10515 [Candidatus Acidiferrales bacterium]
MTITHLRHEALHIVTDGVKHAAAERLVKAGLEKIGDFVSARVLALLMLPVDTLMEEFVVPVIRAVKAFCLVSAVGIGICWVLARSGKA